jgi:UDPglucose--hexose-1-phosphate uridylyltransferase
MQEIKSELRKDYIQDKYVIIAPRRGKRPHDIERPIRLQPPTPKTCVFCPKNIDQAKATLVVGPKNNWQIKVVPNKFPAVSLDNPKAYGYQEVIVETPDHLLETEELSEAHIAKILEVYAQRTKEIQKIKNVQYIIIFKNNGGVAGASLQHAHSQIFATNFIPPHLLDKSQKVAEYRLRHSTCVYCDTIKKESGGPRLIYKDRNVIAFTPYASMYNYEAWILPQRHLDNVTDLNESERKSWAKILKKILTKIGKLGLPYNYYFHQIVNDPDQHLYMKIAPRGSVWAGVEIGSGIIINPISPEEATKFYRK